MKACTIEGCDRPVRVRKMCCFHYGQWRAGRPTRVMPEGHGSTPNPHAEKVTEFAAAGESIASIMAQTGLNKNTVSGLIWRARERGELQFERMIEKLAAQYPGFPRNPFSDRGCLFPNWYEPRDPRFAFCGRPVSEVGGSWCPECRKTVYQKAPAL